MPEDITSPDDAAPLLGGRLELIEGRPRAADVIELMSGGAHSSAAKDRMAALLAQLLVQDGLVDELLQEGRR